MSLSSTLSTRPAPRGPSLWQMAALVAIAREAGAGECRRPKGVQFTTLQALIGFGLVAMRTLPKPRGRRFAETRLRITEAGRQVLASADPAGAVAVAAREQQRQADKLKSARRRA